MGRTKLFTYIAFVLVCFFNGGAYSIVGKALNYFDPIFFNTLRMLFAFSTAFCIYVWKITDNPAYTSEIRRLLTTGQMPTKIAILSGVILGLCYGLLTLAQRSISSVSINVVQPLITLIAAGFTRCLMPNEKITLRNILTILLSAFGALIAFSPNLASSGGKHMDFIDLVFLSCALTCFGLSSVIVKKWLNDVDGTFLCVCQMFGAAVSSICFGILVNGPRFLRCFFQINQPATIYALLLGSVFSCLNSLLNVHIIKTLGPIIAGHTNGGQIVVGTFIGVVFMGDWDNYQIKEIGLSVIGLAIIFTAIISGLKSNNTREEISSF